MANKATIVTDPDPIFGKLTWDSIPYHDPIILTTFLVVVMVGVGVLGAVVYYGKLRYLWDEWLTSVDHKKIGIMNIIAAFIMLIRGFSDALLMRSQQALAVSESSGVGYLPPEPLRSDIYRAWCDYDLLRSPCR